MGGRVAPLIVSSDHKAIEVIVGSNLGYNSDIGGFISTTTKNQIIAGGVTFFVCLLLWLLSWFTAFDSSLLSQVVNYLSIVTHFENFSKGVLDVKDIVFYLPMIFFAIFALSQSNYSP